MVQPVRIDEQIKNSMLVQKSKADAVRVANIITKAESGEVPIADTLEFVSDKVSDKKRNAIIAVGSFIGAVLAYRQLGGKIVPYAKKAAKFLIGLLPGEMSQKATKTISGFINKEFKDVKFVNKISEYLSKASINKVGDALEWGVAGVAALCTSKSANKIGDKIDDAVDLKHLEA